MLRLSRLCAPPRRCIAAPGRAFGGCRAPLRGFRDGQDGAEGASRLLARGRRVIAAAQSRHHNGRLAAPREMMADPRNARPSAAGLLEQRGGRGRTLLVNLPSTRAFRDALFSFRSAD